MIALTRPVSPSLASCELTWLPRREIDAARAAEQHRRYEELLAELGCRVERLPATPELPDAVFVEDTAVVLDELAMLARPGAPARRPEIDSVAEALARHAPQRPIARLEAPATLDGGDVLALGRTLYVGDSTRTNAQAAARLAELAGPHGYAVEVVPVERCLHLKSAASAVAGDTVLLNPDWLDAEAFAGFRLLHVDPREPAAANALAVGETVILPAAFPRTREIVERAGLEVRSVDLSELAKAEGGVTCCSILLPEAAR